MGTYGRQLLPNFTHCQTYQGSPGQHPLEQTRMGDVVLEQAYMLSDYVKSGDHRAQPYARAFARFMASQFPEKYANLLRDGDGRDRYLSEEAASMSNLSVSAELEFDYSEDGRVTSITAHGCMRPSLREMVRLINARARMADMQVQSLTATLEKGTEFLEPDSGFGAAAVHRIRHYSAA